MNAVVPGLSPGTKTYKVEVIEDKPLEIMMLVAMPLGKMMPVDSLEAVVILSHVGRKIWRKKNEKM